VIWATVLVVSAVVCVATAARYRTARSAPEIAFVGLLPWWDALALVLGAVLLCFEQWFPAAIVLAVAAGSGALRCSRREARHRRRQPTPDGAGLQLFFSNLWNQVGDISPLAKEISEAGADVVILRELTPRHLEVLERRATFEGFGWRTVQPGHGATGGGLWSRLELVSSEWWYLGGRAHVRCVVVQRCGHTAEVLGIHVPAPVGGHVALWASTLRDLASRVSSRLTEDATPLVVAGDFNATVDHLPFRLLNRAGLVDAAAVRHRGWRMTWPNRTRWWLPRLLRLDHVLVSANVGIAGYRTGRGTPSDHAPVSVTLTCGTCSPRNQPSPCSGLATKTPESESEAP